MRVTPAGGAAGRHGTARQPVGVGSSFTIWLPISQDGALASVDDSEAATPYTLDLDGPLRRISEDSNEDGYLHHPPGMRTSVEHGDGIGRGGTGGGGGKQAARPSLTAGPGAGPSSNDGGTGAGAGGDDSGGAGGGGLVGAVARAGGGAVSGAVSGAGEGRRAPRSNSSNENLLTITKSGFKVIKPFFSESLMAGACGALPDKAVKTISTVKLSGKRLLQLINDILDAAKMKQGTLVIKHEKVDIKRLVTDVLDLSLPLVRKGVRLVNNVGNVPKIVGDNGRIVQILYNLVGNSAKFTRQGTISITAGVSEDNTKVYVTVSDTGVGIPKEKVSKIFGAFEQASSWDAARRRRGQQCQDQSGVCRVPSLVCAVACVLGREPEN
ncbi:hypothetical protein GPECTOR_92g598 [Gonium pectorale]|uniref:histidine kinase n=1 Tax=Gonium pectorale TaxID=33097 RepID=A0A150G1L1_GONPE|nr:hypothetical protein GPECTOR_92g598 [Gonium pectorale]|eukprot:KXZ43375.1 hypothetical protein GPECTOR_92g598 [Gonium pectorale]